MQRTWQLVTYDTAKPVRYEIDFQLQRWEVLCEHKGGGGGQGEVGMFTQRVKAARPCLGLDVQWEPGGLFCP